MNQSISFIIPAYNCATTIVESVESIFNGNFESGDEVVICNDASTDDTVKVVRKLMKKHPEIKLIEHRFNKGGGAARNTAIEHTTNELIFCLDSDNLLIKDSAPKLKVKIAKSGTAVASFSEIKFFEGDIANVVNTWVFNKTKYSINDMLQTHKHPGASGNYLFTKQSWLKAGRYPEHVTSLDAWGFSIRSGFEGALITILPNSHYFHRVGIESYWVRESKKGKDSLFALSILIPYIDKINVDDVDYLMSKNYRNVWLNLLAEKPIRLKESNKNETTSWLRTSLSGWLR